MERHHVHIPEIGYEPTMPMVLRRAAEKFGAREVLVTTDRRLTFADLERESRGLARRLLAEGVGKASRVAFHFVSGHEFLIAWAALGRIGALAMPLSAAYKPAEVAKILRLGDAQMLLAPATVFGRDEATFLESALPGLGDQVAGRLRLINAPYLRSIHVAG